MARLGKMENDEFIEMTNEQKEHINFMAEIAKSVSDTPMVLKGGTALLLAYGLDRFSEDLDFDSTKSLNMEYKIRNSAKRAKVKIGRIFVKKDTGTTKRYMVNYVGNQSRRSLKIETSFREKEIDSDETTIINGIRVYKLNVLISQKLDAGLNRAKVRDLYDINYLSKNYGHMFSAENIRKLADFASEPDALISRYQQDHNDDDILRNSSLDDLALKVNLNYENLSQDRVTVTRLAEKFSQDKFNSTEDRERFVSSVNAQVENIKEEAKQEQDLER